MFSLAMEFDSVVDSPVRTAVGPVRGDSAIDSYAPSGG